MTVHLLAVYSPIHLLKSISFERRLVLQPFLLNSSPNLCDDLQAILWQRCDFNVELITCNFTTLI